MAFPQFDAPDAIGEQLAWTARFESFDPRNDIVYYTIRLLDNGEPTSTFIGAVSYGGQDPEEPELERSFEAQLRAIAASGQTNTDYVGSPFAAS